MENFDLNIFLTTIAALLSLSVGAFLVPSTPLKNRVMLATIPTGIGAIAQIMSPSSAWFGVLVGGTLFMWLGMKFTKYSGAVAFGALLCSLGTVTTLFPVPEPPGDENFSYIFRGITAVVLVTAVLLTMAKNQRSRKE